MISYQTVISDLMILLLDKGYDMRLLFLMIGCETSEFLSWEFVYMLFVFVAESL